MTSNALHSMQDTKVLLFSVSNRQLQLECQIKKIIESNNKNMRKRQSQKDNF